MTFNELLAYIVTYAADNPTQRRGQATFNAVYKQCPEIALIRRGRRTLIRSTMIGAFGTS
jgi:hypothetical protein